MADVFKIANSDDWHGKVRVRAYRFKRVRLCRDKQTSLSWLTALQAAMDRVRAGEPADTDKLKAAGVERRLMEALGLISKLATARAKSWADHVADYCGELSTAGRDEMYTRKMKKTLTRIGTACKWSTLADAERDAFVRFIADAAKEGAGARTLKNLRDTLRSFLRWAVKSKRAERNALDVFDVDTGDVQTDRRCIRRAMTDAEVDSLLNAVGGQAARALLSRRAGLRPAAEGIETA